MEYRRTVKDGREVYITSILKGNHRPRRLIENRFVEAETKDPLLRILSTNTNMPSEGSYAVAYYWENEWVITEPRFRTWKEAEKFLPGLHLVFPSVAVVQLWPEEQRKEPWMGLDRDDPDDMREDTGEDECI